MTIPGLFSVVGDKVHPRGGFASRRIDARKASNGRISVISHLAQGETVFVASVFAKTALGLEFTAVHSERKNTCFALSVSSAKTLTCSWELHQEFGLSDETLGLLLLPLDLWNPFR